MLKTKVNGFGTDCPGTPTTSDPDCPQCNVGQLEFCCRACWVDDCQCNWDLWMRDRNEGSGSNWASYLNRGPVGETRLELNGDAKAPANKTWCGDISSPCGLVPGPNGYAGEMVCACMDSGMSYPKIFDIVTNLFSADTYTCPSTLGTLCVQCFCDGEWMFDSTTVAVGSGDGMGADGNFGKSLFRHQAVQFDRPCCTPDCVGAAGISLCWALSAKRADGSLYAVRGPGNAPSKFVIADDVDEASVTLYQDGIFIPRQAYEVMHQSVAERAKKMIGQVGIRSKPCCGDKSKRRKPKSLF